MSHGKLSSFMLKEDFFLSCPKLTPNPYRTPMNLLSSIWSSKNSSRILKNAAAVKRLWKNKTSMSGRYIYIRIGEKLKIGSWKIKNTQKVGTCRYQPGVVVRCVQRLNPLPPMPDFMKWFTRRTLGTISSCRSTVHLCESAPSVDPLSGFHSFSSST